MYAFSRFLQNGLLEILNYANNSILIVILYIYACSIIQNYAFCFLGNYKNNVLIGSNISVNLSLSIFLLIFSMVLLFKPVSKTKNWFLRRQ